MTNVAVIYYSSTGNVYQLAQEAAQAAEKAGAEVRLRKVAELAPAAVVASKKEWADHVEATSHIETAALDDLDWADVILFGTPTRFGLPAAQLKQFIDTAGGLWFQHKLENKVVSSFTSTSQQHGGQESTLLALNNTFYHWGAIIVAPGFVDEVQFGATNGNPYGTSSVSAHGDAGPTEENLAAIASQAKRSVDIASALKRGLATA